MQLILSPAQLLGNLAAVNSNLLKKWSDLFQAYDIGESGTISCSDFVKLEIRNGLEQGDLKRIVRAYPSMLRGDPSSKGRMDFMQFCKTRLSSFDEASKGGLPSVQRLLDVAERDLASTMAERFRMGPHGAWEVRTKLKEVFHSWRSSTEVLTPWEWLAASKIVATECDASDAFLSEKWTGKAAFLMADANKDGVLQLEEFVSFSISVLQDVFGNRTQDALQVLRKVCLHQEQFRGFSVQVPLFLPHPPYHFQLPNSSRHSVDCAFYHAGDLSLPSSISQVADLFALLRLKLKLVGKSFSAFWKSEKPEASLELLSSDNCSQILRHLFDRMAKETEPTASGAAIYVKNVRAKPVHLRHVPHQELQVNSLPQAGMRWCLDWESHLVGSNGRLPSRLPINFTIGIGDMIVVQLPNEESGIACTVFMSEDTALSKPVLENVQVVKSKRGKKVVQMIAAEREARGAGEDLIKPPKEKKPAKSRPQSAVVRGRVSFDRRIVIVGQREGSGTFFVEMSWEHQEEVLSHIHHLPAVEASVGRLGPLRVIVEKASPKVPDLQKAKGSMWWTGTKWSPKPPKGKRPRSAK
ncbi:unnamed protein product [Durusdinium trenchii]|uniref:Uncharacterized protein n=2 Tax=Durusdinium trenchii TaxID=1381693 RepID=A0ABP0M624_9DINO